MTNPVSIRPALDMGREILDIGSTAGGVTGELVKAGENLLDEDSMEPVVASGFWGSVVRGYHGGAATGQAVGEIATLPATLLVGSGKRTDGSPNFRDDGVLGMAAHGVNTIATAGSTVVGVVAGAAVGVPASIGVGLAGGPGGEVFRDSMGAGIEATAMTTSVVTSTVTSIPLVIGRGAVVGVRAVTSTVGGLLGAGWGVLRGTALWLRGE